VIGGNRTGRNDIFTMFGILGQETQGQFKVVPSAFAGARVEPGPPSNGGLAQALSL
jgi:hypothetical protein